MGEESNLKFIKSEEIEKALDLEYRQYLCGKLTREQLYLNHITDDIEVGISYYKEFTADKPHLHTTATEHGYVLSGAIKVRCLDSSIVEKEFRTGDFFVIEKGTPYATKNAAGTRIFFMKSPGINDKVLVDISPEIADWLSDWNR